MTIGGEGKRNAVGKSAADEVGICHITNTPQYKLE
jgi:hypothetical protein